MAQDDIIRIIRSSKKWISINDIMPRLNISRASAQKNFKSIIKYRDLYGFDFREGKRNKRYLKKR